LQISSYWKQGDAVAINFLPKIDLLQALKDYRENNPKKSLQTFLNSKLPKRLVEYLCVETGYAGNMADYSNSKLQEIEEQITNYKIKPNGTEGYRTAEVTLGGVDTDEISSKTFEAKKVSGLYFIGEVVDVTGWLGGYNFQWAWASGHACGQFV